MKQETLTTILELFEKESVYLNRTVTYDDLALLSGENVNDLQSDFEKEFGYSLDEMISVWRLCHARELLLKGVPYSLVWKLSGFKSRKELEREWDKLIY